MAVRVASSGSGCTLSAAQMDVLQVYGEGFSPTGGNVIKLTAPGGAIVWLSSSDGYIFWDGNGYRTRTRQLLGSPAAAQIQGSGAGDQAVRRGGDCAAHDLGNRDGFRYEYQSVHGPTPAPTPTKRTILRAWDWSSAEECSFRSAGSRFRRRSASRSGPAIQSSKSTAWNPPASSLICWWGSGGNSGDLLPRVTAFSITLSLFSLHPLFPLCRSLTIQIFSFQSPSRWGRCCFFMLCEPLDIFLPSFSPLLDGDGVEHAAGASGEISLLGVALKFLVRS